jgi:hypothetical protein
MRASTHDDDFDEFTNPMTAHLAMLRLTEHMDAEDDEDADGNDEGSAPGYNVHDGRRFTTKDAIAREIVAESRPVTFATLLESPDRAVRRLATACASTDFRRVTVSGSLFDEPLDEPSWRRAHGAPAPGEAAFESVAQKHGGIGEADIKVLREVERCAGRDVRVYGNDTDFMTILMMAVPAFIDPATGNVREGTRLVLDMDTGSITGGGGGATYTSARSVVDVIQMWRGVMTKFRSEFPRILCPVETLAMLMIMLGTDFVRRQHRLGHAIVWKAFLEGGHVFFARAIRADVALGRPAPRPVRVDEERVMQFVRFCYAYANALPKGRARLIDHVQACAGSTYSPLFSRPQKRPPTGGARSAAVTDDDEKLLDAFAKNTCCAYADIDRFRRKAKSSASLVDFNDRSLRAAVRRSVWNLDYWRNGHTHACPDPAMVCPDGVSVYGWRKEEPAVPTQPRVTREAAAVFLL